MPTETIANTRDAVREHTIKTLAEALSWQTIETGPLEGLEIVSRGSFEQAVAYTVALALPAAASDTGEVTTPAHIVVWARCPRCGISQPIDVSIEPQLLIERTSSELKLKAKAKGRSHLCGQLILDGPEAEGQASFELDDIVGDQSDGGDEPEDDPA